MRSVLTTTSGVTPLRIAFSRSIATSSFGEASSTSQSVSTTPGVDSKIPRTSRASAIRRAGSGP